MKVAYGRKVFIAIIITGLLELLAFPFLGSGIEQNKGTVLFCIVMAVGGGIATYMDMPEEAGEEKMRVVQILTALMLLVAETYAAGMMLL
ncbi:MAG: hypothetical protein IKI99_02825 [Firmicutes bacterium]|nr:hypothetical protein [Bacillota bacterium]